MTQAVSTPFEPKPYSEQVTQAVLECVLRGELLPGDRIYEQDLSRAFKLSRAPIREALRVLETKGVIASEPYKGMHLVPLSVDRVRHINEVRCQLERLALEKARSVDFPELCEDLNAIVEKMAEAASRSQWIDLAQLDIEFHGRICQASDNPYLVNLWSVLAPQLMIIFGVSLFEKTPLNFVDEHRSLVEAMSTAAEDDALAALESHIIGDNEQLDFESIIERRRALNAKNGVGLAALPRPKLGRPPKSKKPSIPAN